VCFPNTDSGIHKKRSDNKDGCISPRLLANLHVVQFTDT